MFLAVHLGDYLNGFHLVLTVETGLEVFLSRSYKISRK